MQGISWQGLAWCFSLAAFSLGLPELAAAASTPNVVMIISDDQGWTDYGFMGHSTIRTPNLDRLARESALFRQGYVTAPLCRPSLASLVTGLHPHQHKIAGNDPAGDKTDHAAYDILRERLIAHIDHAATLPRLLAAKGYLSHQSGKWWEGSYQRGGFTHGMTSGFPHPGGRHGDQGLAIGRQGLEPIFEFIQEAQAQDRPFFIWYAPFMPHTPHTPPKRLLDKYLASGPIDRQDAAYFAMCEWFDETCGELLAYLDQRGLRQNTLVVYVTDNGWKQGSANRMRDGKRSPYEGGVRTPIMLRWPGRIEPGDRQTAVSSVDLVPTILAACGVETTKAMPGQNLLHVLSGTTAPREILFGAAYQHDVQDIDDPAKSLRFRWAVASGRWKIVAAASGQSELYDLAGDPHETTNLASQHPDLVTSLLGRLDAWWTPAAPRTPAP